MGRSLWFSGRWDGIGSFLFGFITGFVCLGADIVRQLTAVWWNSILLDLLLSLISR
jgi:hypothetical protein